MNLTIERTEYQHFPSYFINDLNEVAAWPLFEALERSTSDTLTTLNALNDKELAYRYAPGKWTVRQVVQHIVETELELLEYVRRYANFDSTQEQGAQLASDIAAFEETLWTDGIANDLQSVRALTVRLLMLLGPAALTRRGDVFGTEMSVLMTGFLIAGHNAYHLRIIKERYLNG